MVARDRETGRSCGYGFVVIEDNHTIEVAIAGLNDQESVGSWSAQRNRCYGIDVAIARLDGRTVKVS